MDTESDLERAVDLLIDAALVERKAENDLDAPGRGFHGDHEYLRAKCADARTARRKAVDNYLRAAWNETRPNPPSFQH